MLAATWFVAYSAVLPLTQVAWGMSARDAMRKLVVLGLSGHMTGDGFVVFQEPAAGASIEEGVVCRLVLERTQPAASARAAQP